MRTRVTAGHHTPELRLLAQRFKDCFCAGPPAGPEATTAPLLLDEAAEALGVERRRLYDIVNVLEAMQVRGRARAARLRPPAQAGPTRGEAGGKCQPRPVCPPGPACHITRRTRRGLNSLHPALRRPTMQPALRCPAMRPGPPSHTSAHVRACR